MDELTQEWTCTCGAVKSYPVGLAVFVGHNCRTGAWSPLHRDVAQAVIERHDGDEVLASIGMTPDAITSLRAKLNPFA